MFTVRKLVLGALAAGAVTASGGLAGAQTYYYPAPQPRYYQQPPYQGYVDPRIQRRQLQQQKRFIQKYGYQQPQYGYQPSPYGGGPYLPQQRGYYNNQPGGPYYNAPPGAYGGVVRPRRYYQGY